MDTNTLMGAISARTGLSSFDLENNGMFQFRIDSRLLVTVEVSEDHSHLYIYATFPVVAPLPAAAWARLLEANLLGAETAGAAFAFDHLTDEIILCRKLQVATTRENEFLEIMDDFTGTLEYWTGKFSEPEWWKSTSSEQAEDEMDFLMMLPV